MLWSQNQVKVAPWGHFPGLHKLGVSRWPLQPQRVLLAMALWACTVQCRSGAMLGALWNKVTAWTFVTLQDRPGWHHILHQAIEESKWAFKICWVKEDDCDQATFVFLPWSSFSSRAFKTMELSLQLRSCHLIILLVNYGCWGAGVSDSVADYSNLFALLIVWNRISSGCLNLMVGFLRVF